MRAIEIVGYGGPEMLRVCEREKPLPGAGEVLIAVHAAGINRPDVLQRMGRYPVPPGASDLPGLEVAGEIIAGDMTGTHLTCGQMVCALVQGGGYAEYCLAPAAQCLPLPDGWSPVEAASLPETLFTVWSNVFDRACLRDGEILLVQGGASGIGVTAIQLATALGHRVLATAGSEMKCRAIERLGAVRGINYRDEDFVEIVKQETNGQGVDVVLDMVGGDYLERELRCLADDGRIALIALLGGAKAQVDLGQLLRRRLTITGSTLRPRPVAFKAAIAKQLYERVWPLLAERKIRPVIDRIYSLEKVGEAHAWMEGGQHIGKIMLQVV